MNYNNREMYLVSILVPIYKVEPYIERCVRSLFEQTYPELEFVFVDDCSPDNSCGILQRLLEEYPNRKRATKLLHHRSNRGLAAARNTALDNATGDFVCVVDSDDWLEDDAIEKLVRKQCETDADIVSGNALMHYEDCVKELSNSLDFDKEKILIQQLKDTWTMCTFIWGRIFRRSLYEDHSIRCKEGANYAEDRYQVVRLFYYANTFGYVEDIVYNYEKRNDASITVMQRQDIKTYLRNQYQHLQNWIGIRDFFSDKESQYYQLTVPNTSQLLELNLKWSLKYKTKEDFQHMVELIDENEDCMRVLGWQKGGIKGFFLRNYCCMKSKQLAERSIRFVKRKLHLGKDD